MWQCIFCACPRLTLFKACCMASSEIIFPVIQLLLHCVNMIICEYLRMSKLESILSLDSHLLRLRDIRVKCVEYRVASRKVTSKATLPLSSTVLICRQCCTYFPIENKHTNNTSTPITCFYKDMCNRIPFVSVCTHI